MDRITIVVRSVGHGRSGQLFEAALEDGRVLVPSSRQPFFAAARVLRREGVDPKTRIVMRHAASGTESLSGTVGKAAGLTVMEGDRTMQFGPYRTQYGDED